jgi:cell division protein FtsB
MRELLIQIGVCLGLTGCFLFSYLEKQNALTQLKIRLPELEKEIGAIREESRRLRYEISLFENPNHLIELAHRPEFGHLKHPLLREIMTVPEAIASNE